MTREGLRELAEALDRPLSEVMRRAEALTEFNPMLGMRGVRLGVVLPEIYDMQAQAIFEATVEVGRRGAPVVPEIMIPLVSPGARWNWSRPGSTPWRRRRAPARGRFRLQAGRDGGNPARRLRAGEIAQHRLPVLRHQRPDADDLWPVARRCGRFMNTYVQQGVFPEDPFHILDVDGVGELLLIGAERGRRTRPDLTLSICGEHGGNPESIAFCRKAGFDYVSCSPYRVPSSHR
jgi:pyruvate, orthophosphate dikinase